MKLLCIAIYRMPPSLRSLCTNHFLGEGGRRFVYFPSRHRRASVVDVTRGLVFLQAGCPSRACCSFTLTLWGRLCLKETQRHPTTPRLTNATMLALPWAAGECASMHSALLSTQVRHSRNPHPLPRQPAGSFTALHPTLRSDFTFGFFVSFLGSSPFPIQPYWKNWRSVSLSALCISLPTWRLV